MCHDPKSPTHSPPPLRDDAKISGTGFASALTLLGNADATANDYVSGALALAFAGDSSTVAEADFGSFATAFAFGGEADARSLPAGIALAVNIGSNDSKAVANALGGVTLASYVSGLGEAIGTEAKTVCTAVYGSAQITEGGQNVSSCTSVLFLFQQSQQGDGPVVYAIKNPLDVTLNGLMPDAAADFFATLVKGMGGPAALGDILGLKLVPGFGSDLIRVEMGPDGPKLGSDVGDWLSRLGSNAPSTTEPDTGDTPTTAESAADVTPTPVIDASEPAPESDVDTSPATQTPQTGLPAAELDDAATPVDTGTPEEAADTAPDSTQDAPEADDSAIAPVDEAPASGSADADSDSSDSPEIE